MSMLIGETMIVISEQGQTEHHNGKMIECVYKHLHMQRLTRVANAYVYDRTSKDARHLENVQIENGRMTWEHTHALDYSTLAEKKQG